MVANSKPPDTGERLRDVEGDVYNLQRERTAPESTLDNCPTGMVAGFLTANPPQGWLLLNGQAVTAAGQPALYAYLTANSLPTTLPDYRDRVPIGAGNLYTSTSTGGSADATAVSHTHSGASHTHPGFDHNHGTGLHATGAESGGFGLTASASFADRVRVNGSGDATGTDGAAYTTGAGGTGATGSSGSSGTGANLPPYRGLYWMIRT